MEKNWNQQNFGDEETPEDEDLFWGEEESDDF